MMEEKSIQLYQNKGKDSYSSVINNIPIATHFYFISDELYLKNPQNLKPFTHSGFVLNFLYTPFLEMSDFNTNLYKIPYDQKNLGTVADEGHEPEKDVYVYKIFQGFVKDKEIGSFNKYPSFNRETNRKHFSNESKLYQYPYHYLTINDYINSPLILNTQYLKQLRNSVYVSQPITTTGGYTIYVPEYKGDKNNGSNEGLFSACGLDLPTSSSQYAQFMANSKANFQKQVEIAERTHFANDMASIPSAITGAISGATLGMTVGSAIPGVGNVVGGILGAAGGFINSIIAPGIRNANEKRNKIETSQAQVQDIMRAPRNVNLSSSDILMTLDRGNSKIWVNRYTISDYYKEKLCDYWTLYGYKQNKLMFKSGNGLIKTRRHFNYIKTIDANIIGTHIDKSEVELIKQIFDSGITFWHQREMEQDNIKMYDYHLDNVEFERQ